MTADTSPGASVVIGASSDIQKSRERSQVRIECKPPRPVLQSKLVSRDREDRGGEKARHLEQESGLRARRGGHMSRVNNRLAGPGRDVNVEQEDIPIR